MNTRLQRHLFRITPIVWLGLSLPAAGQGSRAIQDSAQWFAAASAQRHTGRHTEGKQGALHTPVTLLLKDVTMQEALDAIARQAKLRLSYKPTSLPPERRVNLQVNRLSAKEAIAQVLKGSDFDLRAADDSNFVLVKRSAQPQTTSGERVQQTGVIMGRVFDSASRKELPRVTVMIEGTKLSTLTDETGKFVLRNVPVGRHLLTIRTFGYRTTSVSVTVGEGAGESVTIGLAPVATTLSGVVTTATGQEQRLKVPNDIVKLNVDSVLKTAPVSTMSELLTNRVPGVVVQKTSGAPGAPSVIRIRGTSSLSLNNDPIIIVDGVRIYSSVSNSYDANQAVRSLVRGQTTPNTASADFGVSNDAARSSSSSLRSTAPSALDQINPNSIETIEVLRGPSASALYGTDAANGIIVITTKKGRAGPPQWGLNMDQGIATLPGSYPLMYKLWGQTDAGTEVVCRYRRRALGPGPNTCTIYDSLVPFQYLNDDRTTMFGRGTTQRYGAEVRGGSQTLTYALSANTGNEIGYQKMPDVEADRVERLTSTALPSWQRRPLRSGGEDGTARINIAMNPQTDLAFTATVSRRRNQQTPLVGAVNAYLADPDFWDTTNTDIKVPDLRRKTTASLTNSRFIVNGAWRPFSIMKAAADLGWDRSNKSDLDILRRNDCVGVRYLQGQTGQCKIRNSTTEVPTLLEGQYGSTQGTRDVVTMRTYATFSVLSLAGITGPSTIGLNYTSTTYSEIRAKADGLLLGSTSLNGAEVVEVRDQIREDRVAGVFLDQGLDFFGLTYTTVGVRFDRGSGIGRNVNLPTFPKLGFSIPILPPGSTTGYGVSSFRLRTAYGQSAVQPDVSAQLRTFTNALTFPGSPTGLTIGGIGNTQLRPERSVDFEAGFDLGLWQDRVNVTFQRYQKKTRDLNIDAQLPPSINGGGSKRVNLGNMRNIGLETTVDARIIEQEAITVAFSSNFSMNRNRLTKVNQNVYSSTEYKGDATSGADVIGWTRNVVGYPVNGWWQRPLVTYADVDGNGLISLEEIQLADSAVYVGTGQPKYSISFRPSFGFFGNQLNLTAGFNYQNGMVRVNQLAASLGDGKDYQKVFNDTTASLAEQAHALAGTNSSRPINVLRFDEFSLSYNVPRSLTRHLRAGYMSVALQASNLRLWTAYSGKDPNVRSQTTDAPIDGGQLPQPRTWQLRVRLSR